MPTLEPSALKKLPAVSHFGGSAGQPRNHMRHAASAADARFFQILSWKICLPAVPAVQHGRRPLRWSSAVGCT